MIRQLHRTIRKLDPIYEFYLLAFQSPYVEIKMPVIFQTVHEKDSILRHFRSRAKNENVQAD